MEIGARTFASTDIRRGFDRKLKSFVQAFDSNVLDASVLLLPIFGFLPFNDERVKSTMDVIQKKLSKNGFIYRFSPNSQKDRESAFIACSFWMVQNLTGAEKLGAEGTFAISYIYFVMLN